MRSLDENEPDQKVVETVKMEEDRSLAVSHLSMEKGMSPGINMWHSTEKDADYFELLQKHGITKPGQHSSFIKELRDGKWMDKVGREGDW